MIISDKSKLMQELYAKMTQVTDAYNVTHKVMYCGDVEEIIEKFFMDKHSDWLTADKPKDEPQTCSVNGRSYSKCADCEYFRCTADEPQTETSTNNSIISEKLQLKCDLCKREGDDICVDCERKKQSGKE